MLETITALVISLLASAITGIAVWSWGRAKQTRQLRKGAEFFGLNSSKSCRVVVGSYRGEQRAVSQRDVGALVEAVAVTQQYDPEMILSPSDTISEPVGDITEFCIGGPDSNPRTIAHLGQFLGGITAHSYRDEGHRLEITTQTNAYKYEKGGAEHAILARIMVTPQAKPLFLICGQTSLANRGALLYLRKNYQDILRNKFDLSEFCFVVRLIASKTYGASMIELAEDASHTAFSMRVQNLTIA